VFLFYKLKYEDVKSKLGLIYSKILSFFFYYYFKWLFFCMISINNKTKNMKEFFRYPSSSTDFDNMNIKVEFNRICT
jgi:hypothetical protein